MTDVADVPLKTLVGKLRELAPALRAAGVTRLYLFGSRARGDARPDSDLDVLIETTSRKETPQFDYFKALHLIEDHVGLQAQLSMRDLLKPRMAERIADDLIEVF
ncbi:nucleotidyltransferase domain-containing protein [Bradyrhizobium sp. LTSP857]|jgi:predicted nucleotidyltransferase|uniref:nucleotidyltransferase family protein n=1 Tax=Bradyrhizobium sp. LTSP857 TaxID=1619231 RepID=UPI0005D2BF99|nr:nucleotidyltransferase domain-containing protein [Bradyrhizobium sp. LTSP857]KJC41311.1 DNA polymerase [Bradyrhizobium sp. LTSP857]